MSENDVCKMKCQQKMNETVKPKKHGSHNKLKTKKHHDLLPWKIYLVAHASKTVGNQSVMKESKNTGGLKKKKEQIWLEELYIIFLHCVA